METVRLSGMSDSLTGPDGLIGARSLTRRKKPKIGQDILLADPGMPQGGSIGVQKMRTSARYCS